MSKSESSFKETQAYPGQLLVEAALRGDVATISAADALTTDWNGLGMVTIEMKSTNNGWTKIRSEVTALFAAANCGHLEIVCMLLENGADINIKVETGYATTAAARQGHLEILGILLDFGASADASEDALIVASASGNIKIVKLLINRRVMAPTALAHAIVKASSMGYVGVVTSLIEELERHYSYAIESYTRRECNKLRQMMHDISEQMKQDRKSAQEAMLITSKEDMRISLEEESRLMRKELSRTRDEIYTRTERTWANLNQQILHVQEEMNEKTSKLRNDLIVGDDELWIHLDKMHDALNQRLNAPASAPPASTPTQVETWLQNSWTTQAFIKGFELTLGSLCVGFGKLYGMSAHTVKFTVLAIVAIIVVIVGTLTMFYGPILEMYRARNNTVWFLLVYLAIIVAAIGYL